MTYRTVNNRKIVPVLVFARVIALNYLELYVQCKIIESEIPNTTRMDIFFRIYARSIKIQCMKVE